MEPKVKTSAGMETASETVARINAAKATWSAAASNTTTNQGGTGSNALVEMLTKRLTEQGKGISSSANTSLQDSINAAIANTELAGSLTTQRLQSERERELGFAQDRASATITGALESGSGYARQMMALKEMTETTEKSVRDLDKRYQESILAGDAATAQRIADLQIKKLELQQEAETQYMDNLFKAVSLEMQEKQFNLSYGQEAEKLSLDRLASDRGYEMDKIRLAQDKELSEDELAFKYASMAQDRELTLQQIAATLAGKKVTGANATNVTSYILDSLRTQAATPGVNVNDRAVMAAQIRNLLDASGLTEDMEAGDYDKYLSAAYDIFNKEVAAKESLGLDTKDSGTSFAGPSAYPGAPQNIGPFLFRMQSGGGQSIY